MYIKLIYKLFFILLAPFKGFGLRKLPIVRSILGIIKPRKAYVRGFVFNLDPTDETISRELLSNSYEPFESFLVSKLVHQGDNVVDIGANIGYYTVFLAELVGTKRGGCGRSSQHHKHFSCLSEM